MKCLGEGEFKIQIMSAEGMERVMGTIPGI